MTWKDLLPPGLLALGTGALGALTWTDAVQAADSGEMIAAACNLGVPHPPGYPLYVLAGHAFCALPLSTPAGRLGLMSLASGMVAVLLTYAIVARITANRWAAVMAGLTLATGATFWRYESLAEVFALNAALSLAVVHLSLRASGAGTPREHLLRSAAVGLACGLALSNHHSSVLVMPLAAVAVLLPWRSAPLAAARIGASLAGLFAGLAPYLHLALADPARRPRWGDTSTLAGFAHHVLRRDYGTFSLALDRPPAPLVNVAHFVRHVPGQTAFVLWIAALLGMAALLRRGLCRTRSGPLRDLRPDASIALAVLPILAGPAFFSMFNLDAEGMGGQLTERFHILPIALVAVCAGVGLAAVDAAWLGERALRTRSLAWRGAAIAAVALFALHSLGRADASRSFAVEDHALNSLASVERDAVVLGVGDVQLFGKIYVQQMLRVRPDVSYVDVRLLLYPWYVAQKKQERPPFPYEFTPGNVDTLGLIRRELDAGTPVYLAVAYNDKVMKAFGGYPVGPLFRLLPQGTLPPTPPGLAELNRRLFARFAHRGLPPDPALDPASARLLETYAQTWRSVAIALHRGGDEDGSRRALGEAAKWAPWLPPPRWLAGAGKGKTP
jgi:hypothetical protein